MMQTMMMWRPGVSRCYSVTHFLFLMITDRIDKFYQTCRGNIHQGRQNLKLIVYRSENCSPSYDVTYMLSDIMKKSEKMTAYIVQRCIFRGISRPVDLEIIGGFTSSWHHHDQKITSYRIGMCSLFFVTTNTIFRRSTATFEGKESPGCLSAWYHRRPYG